MDTLFSSSIKRPLPFRLFPESFEQFVGQRHIVGEGKPLRKLLEKGKLFSSIFWGPPGTGKTALARLISKLTSSEFIELNAVTSTIQDVRKALERGRKKL
ncbi:AAA family ATPase [Phorcysia thermohydrogeniphila]|uniref:AAA family ATPase n=1 Tax=Phorcysia thermohydrogeniphila TaxID=936138 RepID=UPI001A9F0FEF|nr:AAA family ATPase [Phorcysia thermohydrogeniphila]